MIKLRRLILAGLLFVTGLAHADWATDRAGETGYVTVTTLASVVDEAVPFFIVYLSDLPAGFHSAMDAASDTDGKTIRLSTADGSTQLACYPVGVNTSTDTGALFCLGTGMSASVDTDYRIYVGNAALSMESVSGGMGRNTVFADYAGFYLPGVTVTDLTGGGRDLTAVNSPGTAASGYEGITAATYNGTTQGHKYDGTQAVAGWPITIEALAYTTSSTTRQWITGHGASGNANNFTGPSFEGTLTSPITDPIAGAYRGNSSSVSTAYTSVSYSTSTWYYVATDRDAGTGTSHIYVNGGSSGSDTAAIDNTPSRNQFGIGYLHRNTDSLYLTGRVAMAALSSSVRSANFIATTKQNWDGNLYSVGSYTALSSCTSGSTGFVLMQTAGQTATADADWSTISNALVDDATAATVTLDDVTNLYSETLKLTNPNYGVTIPTGASYTVTIRVKRSAQTTSGKAIHDKTVQFIDDTGTQVGTNLADTSTKWPASATTKDYTVSGVSFDGTEFTSAAGVAIQADGSVTNGNTTTNIQTVWIKVDWVCPNDLSRTRGFFALSGG